MNNKIKKDHYGNHHQVCDFGWKKEHFNWNKRDVHNLSSEAKGKMNKPSKKGKGNNQPPPPPPVPTSGQAVFLLDFNGQTVSNTSWNYNGDIVCAPANLLDSEVDLIIQNIKNEYAPYNVIITTDESIYNSVPPARRQRVIFTESWEWYGQAGGVSFINSMTWGTDTPCFVFTSLLHYNTKYIKEAGAHELGHTQGLLHHSEYVDCVKTNEYKNGDIMGVGYYTPDELTNFCDGATPYGCDQIQHDVPMLTASLGLK